MPNPAMAAFEDERPPLGMGHPGLPSFCLRFMDLRPYGEENARARPPGRQPDGPARLPRLADAGTETLCYSYASSLPKAEGPR